MTKEEKRYYQNRIQQAVKRGLSINEVLNQVEGECSETFIRRYYKWEKEGSI